MALVLVVDDEFGIMEVLDTLLTGEGYRVQTAPDGRRALERLRSERPDAVLLDYMMPMLDGVGVMRAIQSEPSLAGVPVVFMSSLPEAAIREHVSGYASFLRKPFRIHQVLDTLTRVLAPPPSAETRPG